MRYNRPIAVGQGWCLEPEQGAGKRDFLSVADLTPAELEALLDLAAKMKARPEGFAHTLR